MQSTLSDILQSALKVHEIYEATVQNLTDFERAALEDIIDFGEEDYQLSRYECLENISDLTKKFWKSKLN